MSMMDQMGDALSQAFGPMVAAEIAPLHAEIERLTVLVTNLSLVVAKLSTDADELRAGIDAVRAKGGVFGKLMGG